MKTVLVVGGTSGLGLELAKALSLQGQRVIITGRKSPPLDHLSFFELPLDSDQLQVKIDAFVSEQAIFDTVIYAAGFYQRGHIGEFSAQQISAMCKVGLEAPLLLMRAILAKQGSLSSFVAVTSTSEWTPREYEPAYSATKAGLGMFAKSLSLDPNIGRVAVIGVAGMKSGFWAGTDMDTSEMLDPAWVARESLKHIAKPVDFKHIKVLRQPPRIEVIESFYKKPATPPVN